MSPCLVYVAGPYSSGDTVANVEAALDAGHALMDAGFAVVVPHLAHYLEARRSRPYEEWMALDFALLDRCGALLRLPGHSPGADREVAHALSRGIPVFDSIAALREAP